MISDRSPPLTTIMLNHSFVVTMNSKDRYKIIRLLKISHSMKQPCRSVCLKKALEIETIQYLG